MFFDVLFEIWENSDPKTRRKFILAYKPFYEKGKEYLTKTRSKKVCPEYKFLLREHDMIRKAYETRDDFFKYKLKPLKELGDPKYWRCWGLNKKGFLHALYLEEIIGINVYYECLKFSHQYDCTRGHFTYINSVGSQTLVDTFKTLDFCYFQRALKCCEGKIWNNISATAEKTESRPRYTTTKHLTQQMRFFLDSLPIRDGVYDFPNSFASKELNPYL